jgi:hypothetical protein
MSMCILLFIREEDNFPLLGHVMKRDDGLWLVPEWYEGPRPRTLKPARIISLADLHLTKSAQDNRADLVLATPLSKDVLEGRSVGQPPVVIEAPDIVLNEDRDFHRCS